MYTYDTQVCKYISHLAPCYRHCQLTAYRQPTATLTACANILLRVGWELFLAFNKTQTERLLNTRRKVMIVMEYEINLKLILVPW